jgi:RimJ/RimL family protein N-acetyltransferase
MAWSLVKTQAAGDWVAERIDGHFAERSMVLGCEVGGKLVAGVIYEAYNHASVLAHIAIDGGRLPAGFVGAIFHYPFIVCSVGKIICPVADGNQKSARLARHFGFQAEARIEEAHPSGGITFYTLKKEACRYLGGRYGQKFTITTSSP